MEIWRFVGCVELFVAEGDHGIDAHGVDGEVGSEQDGEQQEHEGCGRILRVRYAFRSIKGRRGESYGRISPPASRSFARCQC